MKYSIEYMSLNDIIRLYHAGKLVDMDKNNITKQKEITSVCFDIIMVYYNNNIINLLCSDKETLKFIKMMRGECENLNNPTLNKMYRCIIIKYSNIVEQINYDEFCSRYRYKI